QIAGCGRRHHQMVMRRHEHESMDIDATLLRCASQSLEELLIVVVGAEDRTVIVSALDDVNADPGDEDATWTWHAQPRAKSGATDFPSKCACLTQIAGRICPPS